MSKIDASTIVLGNERSTHVEKKLNRLTTWKFFQVLYRNDMFKMILMNLLMLLFLAPTIILFLFYASKEGALGNVLPYSNALGIGSSAWLGVTAYSLEQKMLINAEKQLWLIPALVAVAFAISGGFAILRDAFWTGRIKLFKPFFTGIANNIGYTLTGCAILSLGYYGIYSLNNFMTAALPSWLAITITVICYILLALIGLYCFVLFAVTSTYKQSVRTNLSDSWKLLWLNPVPNMFSFLMMGVPVLLYFILSASMLRTLLIAVFLMFGMFYVVLVWMTTMMKTFALFHPVAKKKASQQRPTTTEPQKA